ncbi:peptidase M16 [Thalassotalea euphylliae]|uniref:Protease 3 n=1 Tax=Thalassotalea euphylliae TaxID=1655234 RepID=A0A3E0TNP1_9GAMM|nr:insulinase family protein [Thalassotalea euphylliae]REL26169.1 peptidase M16 [Thalassotalea euphylliae]
MLKQSPNDKKHYLPITLSNGLRVLLIQNTESEKAAAALAINAGHFDDPQDREGLAHFVEHMLFLGTKNYPDGSEYQKFISQHGGHHNAWTGTEHTCFFFDIQSNYLADALARFADFFISPLLSEAFVESERQNIDAEFKLKLKDDIRRLYDVHKATVNPAHPFSQFSVGNLETLADRPGQNAQADIMAYFERNYRANLMTLALEGPQTVAELKQLATQYFSGIKAGGEKAEISAPLYLAEHLAQEIAVTPVKEERQLIVSFAMPGIDKYYQHKPESVLTYLLGHEGKGSILSLLKRQHLAMALTAGSGINGSNFKDFNISISLTEYGEANIEQVLDVVFSYIQLLKQRPLPHNFYNEKQKLTRIAFDYMERLKPLDSVNQLAVNMQHYPVEDYIAGDYLMTGMCDDSVEYLLTFLSPRNCRIIKIGQHYRCDKLSPWYQVPYHIQPIAEATLARWQDIAIHPDLTLPAPNPYIIAAPKIWSHSHESSRPAMIDNHNGLCVWYKQDTTYKVPKGYIYIGIDSPLAIASTANIVMTRMFVDIFGDQVTEEHYDAELAGIHYHLYAHQGGMTLQISGLSEKQPLLLERLLASLMRHDFSEQAFELSKKQHIKQWQNADKNKSISQLFATLSAAMQPNNPSAAELLAAISSISFAQFLRFCGRLFEHITLDVLIHGNWLEKHAQAIAKQIQDGFNHCFDGRNHVSCPVINIAEQQEYVLPVLMPEHDHAAVCYYPQVEKSEHTTALTMLTSHFLAPLFFQEMRTEKQYGYLVNVGYIPINRYPGIAFYIQSPHTSAAKLVEAIDEFIETVCQKLTGVSEAQWQTFKFGLSAQLAEKDTSLRTKSQRFWAAISNQDFTFDRKQRLLNAINNVELSEIIAFVSQSLTQHLSQNNQGEYLNRLTLVSAQNEAQTQKWQQRAAQLVKSPSELPEKAALKY